MASLLVVCAGAVVTSWLLTGVVRRMMLTRGRLDVPNDRSSHTVPTPRGGGLAVAAVVLPAIATGTAVGWIPFGAGMALGGGGVMVAVIGWLDDWLDLPARPRLLVHLAAALWALAWLGGLPRIEFGGGVGLPLGLLGWGVGTLGIVWAVNFYNFMDGIDGIAGGEAVVVGIAGGLLLLAAGSGGLAVVPFLVAAACAGFLIWNWAPARIFMGDVGSGLVGYLFAVAAIASENAGAVPLLLWVLLLGVFVVDATLTLVRRALDGAAVFNAHREHGYQRLVQGGWSHASVTASVMAIGIALAGIAALALYLPRLTLPLVLAGIGTLGIVHSAVLLRAADAERAEPATPAEQPAHRAPDDNIPSPALSRRAALAVKRGRIDTRL